MKKFLKKFLKRFKRNTRKSRNIIIGNNVVRNSVIMGDCVGKNSFKIKNNVVHGSIIAGDYNGEFNFNDIFNNKNLKYKNKEYNIEDSFKITNISSLKVSSTILDVYLHSIEGEKVIIKTNFKGNFEKEPELIITRTNNSAEIYVDLGDYCEITSKNSVLEIFIPEKFKGTTDIKTVSSNVNITNFNLNINKIKTNSGEIFISNSKLNLNKIDTTSGDFNLINTHITNNLLKINTTSGDCKIDTKNLCKVKINSTSGDIKLISNKALLKVSFKSTCGDASGKFINCNKQEADICIHTTTGDLEII